MNAQIINPFAFFEAFPKNQTVAIVGNSGALAGWRMGQEIDRAEVVVRFNECRLQDWETQVGTRTDLLITNPYVENREQTVGVEIHPKMAMVIFPHQRRGSQTELMSWLGGVPFVTTFAPRLERTCEVPQNLPISTGTYGIYLMSRLLLPRRMMVTGFSMFNARYAPYYWSATIPAGVAKHDFPREALVFVRLLNSFTHAVAITPEIAELFSCADVSMGSHIELIAPLTGDQQ